MNYLLIGFLLACSATIASCLQCHMCQTMERGTCNDPYPLNDHNMDNLDECDDDHYCVKYKTVVKIRDSGYITGWERDSKVVTRSCEPRQGKSEGCIGWQNNGGISLKCWCGTDGCNSGRSLTPSAVALVLGVCLSMVAIFMRSLH